MMTVLFTCDNCSSAIHVHPESNPTTVKCKICAHEFEAKFNKDHSESILKDCPKCERKDFYSQRDFNRKLGVLLYLIPTAVCLFVGLIEGIIGYFIFWLVDMYLYRALPQIAICYKCNTIFRSVKNIANIPPFNHEMNDRIVYSDHDFKGKPLEH